MSTTVAEPAAAERRERASSRRKVRRRTSLFAHGEPMVWLTGGSLVITLAMIAGLLLAVVWFGGATFWPLAVHELRLHEGAALGEVVDSQLYEPEEFLLADLSEERRRATRERGGEVERWLVRIGNRELTGTPYRWISEFEVEETATPPWALVVERLEWGRFYGLPVAFRVGREVVASDPEEVWSLYRTYHAESRERFERIRDLERRDIGRINRRREEARLRLRELELEGAPEAELQRARREHERVEEETEEEFRRIGEQIAELRAENQRYELVLETAEGREVPLVLSEIVRAYPANRLGFIDKLGVYLSRWWEFLSADPRESNTEGGVYPAIVGTVTMTLIMTVVVVPFGVLAALYLREYARQGTIISMVRIAVNNLAGVPSIVFGVFGLGFFCYIVGASIDELFFEAALPNPTFGKGGVMWASLTLALLTLPVVIVATEEALAAVPSSMREGSYACGATKWQTIRRIVLPRAMPGIMTGMILAIARGAGEVAPLMLVGAVKLAPHLPLDGSPPFIHPSRSFMHLGFHIYDLGFQSPDSEAAKPMVFTTTLLLIAIVVLLNLVAITIRSRLRRKFHAAQA